MGDLLLLEVKKYIDEMILRKREEMEWMAEQEDGTMVGLVVRRTKRTYYRLARLVVAQEATMAKNEPDELLIQYRLSRNKAKPLITDTHVLHTWLTEGWIIKEVKFSADGRTPVSEGYLMGPALFHYEEAKKVLDAANQIGEFNNKLERLRQCLHPRISEALEKRLAHLLSLDFATFKTDGQFRNWSLSKRMQFLEFIIAILTLSAQKEAFDFKEIGAFNYKEIGGSKVFDRNRKDFVSLLEEWNGEYLDVLGLVSHGHITPVFFVGDVRGQYATYGHETLQAVTDMALLKDHFETSNRVLWLVENRAILTRMAVSTDFLATTASIVICIEGNIRSAHRRFIEQISGSPSIEQVLIWTDYDISGLSIADDAFHTLANQVPVKWIASDGHVYTSYGAYKKWLLTQLEFESREQEEVLGDEAEWTSWIRH